FSFNVLLGALTSVLLLWLAVPIAMVFNNPASAPAIQVFAGFTFVAALGQIHQSLLRRRMHFRQLAIVTATSAVVTAVTSIAVARRRRAPHLAADDRAGPIGCAARRGGVRREVGRAGPDRLVPRAGRRRQRGDGQLGTAAAGQGEVRLDLPLGTALPHCPRRS